MPAVIQIKCLVPYRQNYFPLVWHSIHFCNVLAPTTPLVFEPGLITYSESQASALTNSAKGSDRWREASRRVGLSHSSLPQWHQTPLSGNPPFSPGQRETWQSVGSEWTINVLGFTQACGRAPNVTSFDILPNLPDMSGLICRQFFFFFHTHCLKLTAL